jgi:hypothetical protein
MFFAPSNGLESSMLADTQQTPMIYCDTAAVLVRCVHDAAPQEIDYTSFCTITSF